MNVAQVICTFPPHPGGMGYVCYHNALQLSKRGHKVTVFTIDYGMNYGNETEEFNIVRLSSPFVYGDAGFLPQLYPMLKGFDVVHLHYPFFGAAEYVYLASLLRGQRYFLTYHMDVFGDTMLKKVIINSYEALLLRRIVGRADRLGALSREHLMSSKVGKMVDWKRVVELPNGVDVNRFYPRKRNEELVRKYGLEGKTAVLFVGNLLHFKGVHLLIKAMSMIENRNSVLLIIGGGYRETEYKQLVEDTGIKERVIFLGRLPNEELPDYYNLCDFLVLPSIYSESWGLVALEAMASQKPVIVSSLAGPSQVIDDEKDGLIARAGDIHELTEKIDYMIREKEKRTSMGKAAREKVVQQFDWEIIGERLEKILLEIVSS